MRDDPGDRARAADRALARRARRRDDRRDLEKIDAMREASIEQSADIRALRGEFAEQQRTLADHEARVRTIEARMPRGEPRN